MACVGAANVGEDFNCAQAPNVAVRIRQNARYHPRPFICTPDRIVPPSSGSPRGARAGLLFVILIDQCRIRYALDLDDGLLIEKSRGIVRCLHHQVGAHEVIVMATTQFNLFADHEAYGD